MRMTDREEREEHIKRLEAALACEEKQFSGKCSKQTCDDNCALLYEQGNWGEWKETLRYAINSLKIDLKYDLLYEETSGQADKRTTKNDLGVREFEEIVVEYPPEDLCTYPEYKGKPYFGIKYKENEKEIVGYGTYKPEVLSQYLKNYFISTTKDYLGVDAISRQAINGYIDYILSHGMGKKKSFEFIKKFVANLPPVTPQESRKGHWIEEFNDLEGEVRFTCSSCGKYQLFGTDFCYHCGSDNREVEE